MARWEIEREITADGSFWLCAEVRVTCYTPYNRAAFPQRFSVYWTGHEWVDHAQYDRRKRFSADAEIDDAQHARAAAKLREYIGAFYGPS